MTTILQMTFDLPEEPTSAPDWIEEILSRHPELDRARCPVSAYDARLRTSTCLACRRLITDCPGWNRQAGMTTITPHLIAQASRVAELLDGGYTHRQIGAQLGVSSPRVAAIKRLLPQLEPYLGTPAPLNRLRAHRDQLWELRHQRLKLAATIRRDLIELDQELQAYEINQILSLRAE